MPQQSLFSLVRLHRQLGGDPVCVTELIRHFGDAETFFETVTRDWLEEANLAPGVVDRLMAPLDRTLGGRLEEDLRWLDEPDHHLLTLWDEGYPQALAQIPDPPPLLFVRGDSTILRRPQIAVVGSRKMTATGRRFAAQLAGDLARQGLTITSGLALGIDGIAHQAALDAGSETVAVLACGCDRIYPSRHSRLADAIAAAGAIIAELPLGTEPHPRHFPLRNRIVTGLSLGTVVVEAALASGSLVSARLAGEQGREVFAVPGSVYGSQSEGCHYLIKTGATLTDRADDVLQELPGFKPGGQPPAPLKLEGMAAAIHDHLARQPATVDDLARATGRPVTEVLPALINLEIDGVVCGGAGGYCLARS